MSHSSLSRSIIVDGEETPVRYWKDSIDTIIQQYYLEFPGGVRRTYIYTDLPPNFRSTTVLAGLCNICDEQGHENFANLVALVDDVAQKANVQLKHMAFAVNEYQCNLKTKFANQAERHFSCLELCMTHAFQTECPKTYLDHSTDAFKIYKVSSTHLQPCREHLLGKFA